MAVSNVPEKLEATLNAIVEADSEPVKIYRASDSFRENQRSIVTSIPPLRR